MLKRYVLPTQSEAEHEFVPGLCWWNFTRHYNVGHAQYVPGIRVHDGKTEGVMLRWGYVPFGPEGRPQAKPTANVSLTKMERSNLYPQWLASQRCILPFAGFYLWQLTPEKIRQPYFIRHVERSIFGVAAIWDRSTTEDDDVIESCAVITVDANALVAQIHGERRMPAILRRKDYETWLSGTPVQAKAVLQSYPGEWMQAYPVSPRVNSIQYNDELLVQPV
jgi:putative SOS response-associated peptidase YedK